MALGLGLVTKSIKSTAKAGAKVARAGLHAGAPILKNTVGSIIANMQWAKGSGFEGPPPAFFEHSAQQPNTGFEGNPPNFFNTPVKTPKQKPSGTNLTTVYNTVDDVAESVDSIRAATNEVESAILEQGVANPADALEPINDAVDQTEDQVEQLRRVAAMPLVESKQIEQIAEAATGIKSSVEADHNALVKQVEAETLASEGSKPKQQPMATPATEVTDNGDILQPIENSLKEFARALDDLTEQIKSTEQAQPEQQSWIDRIKQSVGWAKDTAETGKDIASVSKSKVVKPLAVAAGKAGQSILSKIFGKQATKLTGSVSERVAQLLDSKASSILGKSIAGAGLVLGSIDAVEHAAKGDWVGVGLDTGVMAGSTAELTGVGAGPGAAIATLSAITGVLRDGYADIFGIPPEQDPSFKQNMNFITQFGVNWVKAKLGVQTKKEQTKAAQQVQAAAPTISTPTVPKNKTPPVAQPVTQSVSTTPPAPTPPQVQSANKPTAVSQRSSPAPKKITSHPQGTSTKVPTATPTPTPASTGSALVEASTTIEKMDAQSPSLSADVIDNMMGRPVLQPINPSGRQRTGTGVLHSPFYPIDLETNKDLYFNSMEIGR